MRCRGGDSQFIYASPGLARRRLSVSSSAESICCACRAKGQLAPCAYLTLPPRADVTTVTTTTTTTTTTVVLVTPRSRYACLIDLLMRRARHLPATAAQ
jgi:hypothetical protein